MSQCCMGQQNESVVPLSSKVATSTGKMGCSFIIGGSSSLSSMTAFSGSSAGAG